jgi:hypothetical protein
MLREYRWLSPWLMANNNPWRCSSRYPASKNHCGFCLAGLGIRRFDPIAEASQLPDHSIFPNSQTL